MLLVAVLLATVGAQDAKALYLHQVQFNTLCGETNPDFYLSAQISSNQAVTAPQILQVNFPDPIEVYDIHQIDQGLFIWKYEIEDYVIDTLTLEIYQSSRYDSDVLISRFTVQWDDLPASSAGAPTYIRLVGSAGRSECATQGGVEEVLIWIWAEDASNAQLDGNGRIVSGTANSATTDDGASTWAVTVVITLSVAVVMVAVAIPALYLYSTRERDVKEFEPKYQFKESVKRGHLREREGYRGTRERPRETFDEEGERYSSISFSQVSIPVSQQGPDLPPERVVEPHRSSELRAVPILEYQTHEIPPVPGVIEQRHQISHVGPAPGMPPSTFVVNNPHQHAMQQPVYVQQQYQPHPVHVPAPQYATPTHTVISHQTGIVCPQLTVQPQQFISQPRYVQTFQPQPQPTVVYMHNQI